MATRSSLAVGDRTASRRDASLAGGRSWSSSPPDGDVGARVPAPDSKPTERPVGAASRLPAPAGPTLSELFAAHPRDAGWAGLLLARLPQGGPLLWVQERMAILEAGRVYPPGLAAFELVHVEARDTRSALWAMEEGLRCSALGGVIGELWGEPGALDFTATRRLAFAAEKHGVPCWLVRIGAGAANLSGARFRWRVASAPSLANPLNAKAPGPSVWEAELFRARGAAPGTWRVFDDSAHRSPADSHRVDLAPAPVGRAVGEDGWRR